jgi:hypothetical protein
LCAAEEIFAGELAELAFLALRARDSAPCTLPAARCPLGGKGRLRLDVKLADFVAEGIVQC